VADRDHVGGKATQGQQAAWFVGAFAFALLVWVAANLVWNRWVFSLPSSTFDPRNVSWLESVPRLVHAGIWLVASIALGAGLFVAIRRWAAPPKVWLAIVIPEALAAVASMVFYAPTGSVTGGAWIGFLAGPMLDVVVFALGAYLGALLARKRRANGDPGALSN
jgi:hypothetical protein